jgi:hypothetical protein
MNKRDRISKREGAVTRERERDAGVEGGELGRVITVAEKQPLAFPYLLNITLCEEAPQLLFSG